MTVVVAVVQDGHVYMGADTGTFTDIVIRDRQSKIWRHPNGMIMGHAGDVFASDMLRHGFTPPEPMEGQSLDAYMRFTFTQALRVFLKEHMTVGVKGSTEDCSIYLLVGWRGRLWSFSSNFAFVENNESFHAIGAGANLAFGALFALADASPLQRVRGALEAAAHFSHWVRPPFDFLTDAPDEQPNKE